jgi:hypothetical protein
MPKYKSILISGLLTLFIFSGIAGCKGAGSPAENTSAVVSSTAATPTETLPVETKPAGTIPVEITPTFTETPPATQTLEEFIIDRLAKTSTYLQYYVNSSDDVQKDLYMRGLAYFDTEGRLCFQYDLRNSTGIEYNFQDLLANKSYIIEEDQIKFGPDYTALPTPVSFLKKMPEYKKLSTWHEDYIRKYINSTLEIRKDVLSSTIHMTGSGIFFDFTELVYFIRRGMLMIEDNQIKSGPRYAAYKNDSLNKMKWVFVGEFRNLKAAGKAVSADLMERASSEYPGSGSGLKDIDNMVANWMVKGIYVYDEKASAFDYETRVFINKEVLNFGPQYSPPP